MLPYYYRIFSSVSTEVIQVLYTYNGRNSRLLFQGRALGVRIRQARCGASCKLISRHSLETKGIAPLYLFL